MIGQASPEGGMTTGTGAGELRAARGPVKRLMRQPARPSPLEEGLGCPAEPYGRATIDDPVAARGRMAHGPRCGLLETPTLGPDVVTGNDELLTLAAGDLLRGPLTVRWSRWRPVDVDIYLDGARVAAVSSITALVLLDTMTARSSDDLSPPLPGRIRPVLIAL